MIIYMKSAHQAVQHKHAQWQVVHEGRGGGGQEFLVPLCRCFLLRSCISKYISTFGPGGCCGCQVVFALLLALVNIFLWLPLPPPPVANQGQLGRQEGLSPCEG